MRCACTLTLVVIKPQRARQEFLILDKADKRKFGLPAPCVCCGKVGFIMARGLREACYSMWNRRGKLDRFPLTRKPGRYNLKEDYAVERAKAYGELTAGPKGLSRNRACIVLGINVRTAYRYEAWLRTQSESEEINHAAG